MQNEKPELVAALGVVLSDAVVLSNKVQGAHWNVVGSDFAAFHKFFMDIYLDVASSIDPIAEQIRKLGAVTPFRLSEFAQLTKIDEATTTDYSSMQLVSDVHMAVDIAISGVESAFQIANEVNEQGVAEILGTRDDMLKTWRWQLSASLQVNS